MMNICGKIHRTALSDDINENRSLLLHPASTVFPDNFISIIDYRFSSFVQSLNSINHKLFD